MLIPRLLKLWEQFGLARPGCPILIYAPTSQIFAVCDDTTELFRLMDHYGNIVMLDPQDCDVKNGIYLCSGELTLLDVRIASPRDRFVFDYILPEIFQANMGF